MIEQHGADKKRIMFVNRKAPHGTICALEELEVKLIAAAFEQEVSVAFMDDGVFALKKGQSTKELDVKNFLPTYRALEDYDITQIYVDALSLSIRGLTEEDLVIPVKVVNSEELADLMESQDVILSC
jgi:tRNA 2-thiouridine synthesizing protein C